MEFGDLKFAAPDSYKHLDTAIIALRGAGIPDSILQDIRWANGAEVNKHFNVWFDSIKDAEWQTFRHMDHIVNRFIGLQFLRNGMGSIPGIPIVGSVFEQMWKDHIRQFCGYLDSLNVALPEDATRYYSAFVQMLIHNGASGQPAQTRIPSLQINNISQHHKDRQKQFRGFGIEMLQQAFKLMRGYSQKLNYRFELRPIWTLPGAKADQIRQLFMRGGLSQPEQYVTPGQAKVIESIETNQLGSILETQPEYDSFDYDPRQLDLSVWNRTRYWSWFYTSAYARLTSVIHNQQILFGPANIPPYWMARPNNQIPFYNAAPNATMCIEENIHWLDWWSPDQIGLPELSSCDSPHRNMANLMPVICALMTLVSLTTNTGHGQHKPIWTATPFNSEFMRILPRACAIAIYQAEQGLMA